jgi:hypothetical protein
VKTFFPGKNEELFSCLLQTHLILATCVFFLLYCYSERLTYGQCITDAWKRRQRVRTAKMGGLLYTHGGHEIYSVTSWWFLYSDSKKCCKQFIGC